MSEKPNQSVTLEGLSNDFWHLGRGRVKWDAFKDSMSQASDGILEKFLEKINKKRN